MVNIPLMTLVVQCVCIERNSAFTRSLRAVGRRHIGGAAKLTASSRPAGQNCIGGSDPSGATIAGAEWTSPGPAFGAPQASRRRKYSPISSRGRDDRWSFPGLGDPTVQDHD